MTTEHLQKLKESLPNDGIKRLAEKFICSEDYIRKVLNNKRRNRQDIIDEAIRIAKLHKEAEEKRIEKIEAL